MFSCLDIQFWMDINWQHFPRRGFRIWWTHFPSLFRTSSYVWSTIHPFLFRLLAWPDIPAISESIRLKSQNKRDIGRYKRGLEDKIAMKQKAFCRMKGDFRDKIENILHPAFVLKTAHSKTLVNLGLKT